MKIKGKVLQIITPEKAEGYLIPKNQHFEDCFYIVINSLERQFMFFIKESWTVVMKTCEFKKGEIVEIDVEDLLVSSGLYKKAVIKMPFTKKWIWKCPVENCGAHGMKPNTHRNARHYARWHMISKHGIRNGEPIIERV